MEIEFVIKVIREGNKMNSSRRQSSIFILYHVSINAQQLFVSVSSHNIPIFTH